MAAVGIHMMVHLECLDKAFYDKFSYADYTAIGFIISVPGIVFIEYLGDVLFMIEDNSMGLMPGVCMFLIMNIWYALSYFPLLYYHRKHRLTKPSSQWSQAIIYGIMAVCGISYLNA
jgi:hypothetical protein